MPKVTIRDPGADAAAVLFRSGTMNVAEIGRRTRIPKSSISRYAEDASMLRLPQFARCCQETGMSDEQIVEIVKIFFRKGR